MAWMKGRYYMQKVIPSGISNQWNMTCFTVILRDIRLHNGRYLPVSVSYDSPSYQSVLHQMQSGGNGRIDPKKDVSGRSNSRSRTDYAPQPAETNRRITSEASRALDQRVVGACSMYAGMVGIGRIRANLIHGLWWLPRDMGSPSYH